MKKETRISLLSEFAPILDSKKGLINMYQTYSTYMINRDNKLTTHRHLQKFK